MTDEVSNQYFRAAYFIKDIGFGIAMNLVTNPNIGLRVSITLMEREEGLIHEDEEERYEAHRAIRFSRRGSG